MNVDVQTLRSALKLVSASVDRKPSVPVLGCVLLTGKGDRLTLETTDRTLTTRTTIDAVDADGFAIAVDHTTISAILGSAPNGPAILTVTPKGQLQVTAGGAKWNALAQAAAEFPAYPPAADATTRITFQADALASTLASVAPSIAGDDNRYGLSGAHVELQPTRAAVRFVATDGNRLNLFEVPAKYDHDSTLPRKMLVPRLAVTTFAAACSSGEVVIDFADRSCVLTSGDTAIHCRMMEADFPDYRQVIPTAYTRRLVIDSAVLAEAVGRVAMMASDKARTTRLDIDADGTVTLSARKLDAGDATATCTGTYTGEAFQVGVNAGYLLDALKAIGVATVRLDMDKGLSPIKIRPVDGNDEDCLCVVMPVRLD